jgi:hypothetical protein
MGVLFERSKWETADKTLLVNHDVFSSFVDMILNCNQIKTSMKVFLIKHSYIMKLVYRE